MGPIDEPALVAELRRGDAGALERLYGAYRSRIFGFLLRLCRDRYTAEDLHQNTWLKVARAAHRLRDDSDLKAWLFTIARNEYKSHRRAQFLDFSRILAFGRERSGFSEPAREGDTDLGRVSEVLGELSDSDRELLLLVGVEGLEHRQAAAVLGISYAALRQRLARARRRFAERLGVVSELEPLKCVK